MQVTLEKGNLCLRCDDGSLYAEKLGAELIYTGPYRSTLHAGARGEWSLHDGVARCDNVTVTFVPEGEGLLIRTAFTNNGEDIPSVNSFNALTLQMASLPERALVNRPHFCRGIPVGDMKAETELVSLFWGSRVLSSDFAAVRYKTGNGLFGFVTNHQSFTTVEICGDGVFTAAQVWEGHTVKQGETLISDWLYIGPCGDMTEALPAFGNLTARINDVPPPRFEVPVGHCSWYYYKNDVTPQAVKENTDWFFENRERLPVRYIQTDDGWYDAWGDWNENEKFTGMENLTEYIRQKGFVPGIWFCPLGAAENSRVFVQHPDWFVKGNDGAPMRDGNGRFCFDFSQDAPCDYLKSVVRRFTKWHIGFIKMDIISDSLCPGKYADFRFNSLKNLRKCLSLVREAAGDSVFLLGCNMPFWAALGTVDGMRTSADVFDHWDSLPQIFGRVIKRYWMNGRLFWNDGDCLIVRTAGEEDALCRRPCSRNHRELQTYVTAMAATGGAMMFSDKMALLKEWQLDLLQSCYPINSRAAKPLDLMENERPALLDFGTENGVHTVAVINWCNREMEVTVPCAKGKTVFEFWSRECRGQSRGDFTETVEPHGCRVFHITEPGMEDSFCSVIMK